MFLQTCFLYFSFLQGKKLSFFFRRSNVFSLSSLKKMALFLSCANGNAFLLDQKKSFVFFTHKKKLSFFCFTKRKVFLSSLQEEKLACLLQEENVPFFFTRRKASIRLLKKKIFLLLGSAGNCWGLLGSAGGYWWFLVALNSASSLVSNSTLCR